MARYSFGEEVANSVTHGVGWLLSVCGLAILMTLAAINGGALRVVSCAVFGATLVLLYAASTLYHALPSERVKQVFRVLDHSAIFLLIAGTYTPLSLVAVGGPWGSVRLFGAIWGTGRFRCLAQYRRPRSVALVVHHPLHLNGLVVVIAIRPLVAAVSNGVLVLIVAGGLAYTLGLVFYGWRRLPYNHAVWASSYSPAACFTTWLSSSRWGSPRKPMPHTIKGGLNAARFQRNCHPPS